MKIGQTSHILGTDLHIIFYCTIIGPQLYVLVERASRTSQSLSSSSSTASLSDTETESSNGASTARSSSSQDSGKFF